MAARTPRAVSAQTADGQVAMSVHDAPGGLAVPRAAGGLPPGLPVTIGTLAGGPGDALSRMGPPGDNVIVAGSASGQRGTRAMPDWAGGSRVPHPACPAATVAGGPGGLGGDRHASSRR